MTRVADASPAAARALIDDGRQVSGAARLRLYRAFASEHWMLGERDERVPVNPQPS